MKTKILKTEQEYNTACERIYDLIHITDLAIEPESPEGEELELLSLFLEKYEQENHNMNAPDPIKQKKISPAEFKLKVNNNG